MQNSKENHFSEKNLRFYIENIFGFSPKNIHVYKLAFKHRSAATEIKTGLKVSNERLEYLGDAILGAVIADYLYKKFPFKDEGFLTDMRSKIVSRNRLNKLAQRLGMYSFIETSSDVVHINKDIIGNAFEAFVGALYIDRGFKFTKRTIINKVLGCHLDIDQIESEQDNYKSMLFAHTQAEKKSVSFKVCKEETFAHKKLYTVELMIDAKVVATGTDHSIKGAEQNAAESFLKNFDNTPSE